MKGTAEAIKANINRNGLAIGIQLFLILCAIGCLGAAEETRSIVYSMGFWTFPALVLLFVLCTVAAHAIVSRRKRKTETPQIVIAVLAVVSVLLTGLLFPALSEKTATNVVELYCGERSDISRGAEIWLHSYEVDGEWYDAASARIQQQANFVFDDARQEYCYRASEGDGYLRIEVPTGRNVSLTFLRHSFAGIVDVSVNGGEEISVDTYSQGSDYYTVELSAERSEYHDPVSWGMLVLSVLGCFCVFLGVEQLLAASIIARYETSSKKKILFRIAVPLFLLFAAGFVFWFWGTDRAAQGAAFWTRLFSLSAIVLWGAYVFVRKGIFSKEFWESAKKRTVVIAGAIALCITLLVGPVLADRAFPNIIEIYCGEKNEQSSGTQVWLSNYTVDGKTKNIHSLRTTEAHNVAYRWERGVYLCLGGKGYLRIELPRCSGADLGFLGFDRGGIVEISVNGGEPQHVDLYSAHTKDVQAHLNITGSARHGAHAYIVFLAEFCGCFGLVFLIAAGLGALAIKTRVDTRQNKKSMMSATVLFPVMILLYFYSNNSDYIPLKYVVLIGLLFAALYALMFWIVGTAASSSMAAWCCGILMTVFFFKTDFPSNLFPQFDIPEDQQVIFGLGTAALLSLVVAALAQKVKLRSNKILCVLLLSFTGAICAMNALKSAPEVIEQVFTDSSVAVKEDYVVEPVQTSDEPHIYWIHCDGLLGFSSVEKYYQEDQSEIKEELENRGFVINETAYFAAGRSTRYCVPALMCPDFYDSVMFPGMIQAKDDKKWCKEHDPLLEMARNHNEMIEAFQSVSPVSLVGPASSEEVYIYDFLYEVKYNSILKKVVWDDAKLQNDLFYISTFTRRFIRPLYHLADNFRNDYDPWHYLLVDGINMELEANDFFSEETVALKEAMKDQEAMLTIVDIMEAHFPFERDENGELNKEGSMDPLDYYPQHQYALKVIMATVDLILERDPDAVIVLQADHGLHGCRESSLKETFGEDAVAGELWNQVFSAVRIPEQYWNGEEYYAYENPLNISRYLVNRFVGDNYEYIGE